MNWTLVVAGPARKSLAKIPDQDRRRLLRALAAMQQDPFSGDIKNLQPSRWRRRVGSYRIFFDLITADQRIVVTAIERRTSTTY